LKLILISRGRNVLLNIFENGFWLFTTKFVNGNMQDIFVTERRSGNSFSVVHT
jgi:hypothetical protein